MLARLKSIARAVRLAIARKIRRPGDADLLSTQARPGLNVPTAEIAFHGC